MSWRDLGEGILGEFAERSADVFLAPEILAQLHERAEHRRERRRERVATARGRALADAVNAAARDRRATRRRERLAARPPCPRCGGAVTREGGRAGWVPIYCSRACAHRAANARHDAKRRGRAS